MCLCVSNQTNRLRRNGVRTPGRMDTKSEGNNMVSVLWMSDRFPGWVPSRPVYRDTGWAKASAHRQQQCAIDAISGRHWNTFSFQYKF